MNVNGLLTKRWLSHLESNQNSGYQKPVCSRYTMGQAELRILYHISFTRRPRVVDCLCYAGLPSNVRPRSGNGIVLVCLSVCGHGSGNGTPCAGRAICASSDPLGVYIYAVGVESCATRLIFAGSAPLIDIAFGDSASHRGIPAGGGGASRAWHPREFGAVLGGSASLPLPASPLPLSSRRYAPLCFVGEYTSSPCDVSHRASDEPRRSMSLSSALAPSSLASPSIRRVFLRSLCARRRLVSSLNLAATHPHPA